MSNNVEVFVEICREGAVIPKYAKQWDAGMDICAAEDVIIRPGETVIIPTGLKMAIPEGYEIQVRPRSGVSLNTPLRLSNSPGTIDSGYRDEIGIIVTNTSAALCNKETSFDEYTIDSKGNKQGVYKIRKGDRVAQIVLQQVPRIQFKVVDSVKEIGSNRGGGFGSTGVRD
ncbi:dUTP diphosphatase [Acetivibrio straminisolvens]|jgi:dUTP pyrophosphatase|uniref:dUTP diphosphatase n=1 Tax=Acetivibrio straminisolvens JCM 21531 TaxID=1294263 RepID=W4VA73_9FIRM|nr:aminotransferase [Acetivibrio straminisolvens]GAE90076.1 deoxyuridine 5'-triphosphate nucleotidohydrolase [Acetivibrio straminisolvens JCM 21531]